MTTKTKAAPTPKVAPVAPSPETVTLTFDLDRENRPHLVLGNTELGGKKRLNQHHPGASPTKFRWTDPFDIGFDIQFKAQSPFKGGPNYKANEVLELVDMPTLEVPKEYPYTVRYVNPEEGLTVILDPSIVVDPPVPN